MKVFLDFEASSLSDHSYPIEVAWVFEDGRSAAYLIRPAPGWTDWAPAAEAIHGIGRDRLAAQGIPYDAVARQMVEALAGHDLFASAPSWDGKWLSVLLRGAGLPRHALRLRDTDEAIRETVAALLAPALPSAALAEAVERIVAGATAGKEAQPAHRALPDATGEWETWRRAGDAARALLADGG